MWTIVSVLALVLLVIAAVVAVVLAVRVRGVHNRLVRQLGPLVFALGALGCVAMLAIALFGYYKLEARQNNPVSSIKVAGSAEQIARGAKLANLCVACHASTGKLPLDGNTRNVISNPPIGTLQSPNLTPGGPIKDWSDGEVIRAIREGMAKNGRPLLGMPTWSFRYMSDADAQAIVAYLRSQAAVKRDVAARDLNIVAAIAVGVGLAPSSVQAPVGTIVAPKVGATVEYGRYAVAFAGCRDCHGKNLNGGVAPLGLPFLSATPLGPSLLVSAVRMDQAEFVTTMRTGVTPRGKVLPNDKMPWKDFAAAYGEDELQAMYLYLKSVDAAAAAKP
jgi:mono/diheme cytochrome c family protein